MDIRAVAGQRFRDSKYSRLCGPESPSQLPYLPVQPEGSLGHHDEHDSKAALARVGSRRGVPALVLGRRFLRGGLRLPGRCWEQQKVVQKQVALWQV